jgi:hypothetical protein
MCEIGNVARQIAAQSSKGYRFTTKRSFGSIATGAAGVEE